MYLVEESKVVVSRSVDLPVMSTTNTAMAMLDKGRVQFVLRSIQG